MSNEHGTAAQATAPSPALAIARAFTAARHAGRALPDFPGVLPADLEQAYLVQDRAIDLWRGDIAGWKVGYIAEAMRDASGDERLLGPIFRSHLWNDTGAINDIPVFSGAGGFAAVEAEYVLEVLEDAPAGQFQWTPAQAQALPARLYIGVEVASSPLATINVLGPRAVISDFGNNNGLVLGAEIPDWTARAEQELCVDTLIDGQPVGSGGATRLPGGLRAAFAFALARSARRGRPLRRGDLIATGNATGIHDIAIGQVARLRFAGVAEIACRAVPAG
ncbi:2-keto-4-pentenoate hydratase [Stenotrophomonas sp. 24(2023)]|uniref:2-keto-4-pentenoate hydratase n=1 Tax=Stenotrophomonas sp. 24(2023) TaxID=3068324 RepID=UPI0027E0989E|nr:2-keto-4-pentenoate hydratase [Stenotrophomonas sp. 24(2023)]WMJ71122.1 2-keto-4-pentenoate hydratase [Stenotrophomonas sp. 24(2023)]